MPYVNVFMFGSFVWWVDLRFLRTLSYVLDENDGLAFYSMSRNATLMTLWRWRRPKFFTYTLSVYN